MSYVKNYDVGNVRIDEPHSHFIHELPLLSFSDIQHTIGLSLVFQSKTTENAFNISKGYKFNLQKRLNLTTEGLPEYFEDGNGALVPLVGYGDRFMLQDASQRIIRMSGNTFTLENPDYSREIYDNQGRIVSVYDKYGNICLTYQYAYDKLNTITYRDDKVIKFNYYENLGMVESVQYICAGDIICTTGFVYPGAANVTVNHYSGVDFHITYNNDEYVVYSCDNGDTYSNSFSQRLTCNLSDSSLTVERKLGSHVIDTTRYDFVCLTDEGDFDLLEVTNNNGVKTRIQYVGNKPTYSYEYSDDLFLEETSLNTHTYIGNVTYHNNDQAVGEQTVMDGYRMTCSLGYGGEYQYRFIGPESVTGPALLSGWLRLQKNASNGCIYFLGDDSSEDSSDDTVQINNVKEEWTYFVVSIPAKSYKNFQVLTSFESYDIEARDFRVLLYSEVGSNCDNISRVENGLVVKNGNDIDYVVMLDSDTVFYNGGSIIDKEKYHITVNDIIRYKTNQVYGTQTNEIYFNNCQGVIINAGEFKAKYSYEKEETKETVSYEVNVEDANIGREYCINGKTYSVLTEYQSGVNGDHSIVAQTFINNILRKEEVYDNHFDLEFSRKDGVKTNYTRNDRGLIVSQSISDSSGNVLCDTQTSYDNDYTKVLTTTDEYGIVTTYTTDDVWGTVTKAIFCDGSSITNTYDNDMCTQISKIFSKGNSQKTHTFNYSNGNLTGLSDGTFNYEFESGFLVNDGEYSNVKKFGSIIESHQSVDNDDSKVLTSSYPTEDAPVSQIVQRTDRYGRITQIDGIVSNTYDVCTTYNDTAGHFSSGFDCGSGKLAMSQDYITSIKTRFAYDNDNLSVVTAYDVQETVMYNQERFTYDSLNRLKTHTHTYDPNQNRFVKGTLSYTASGADNYEGDTLKSYRYDVNGIQKAYTANSFDSFNRLYMKETTLNQNVFAKKYTYGKTRINKLTDTVLNMNLGTSHYSYDFMGRIKSVVYSSKSIESDYRTYEYDHFGQLVRENNERLDKTFIYQYNEVGNVSSVEEYNFTLCNTPDGDYSIKRYTYDANYPDRLIDFGGNPIEYDVLGYPTLYKNKTYTWNKGKLARIHQGAAQQAGALYEDCTFAYNAYGQRIAKSYAYDPNPGSTSDYSYTYNTSYNYDYSGRLIRECCTENYIDGTTKTREFIYLYDESGMVGVLYSYNGAAAQTYYYHRNLQGDVIAIYDTSGTLQAEYAYDAYGNCIILNASNADLANNNPIRYRGYYYDRETGLYYLNARYYSPEWRRFISPDDTAYLDTENSNGLNLYTYCNNDPVNYADPSGHLPNWAKWLIGGVAFAGAVALTIISGGSLAPVFIGMGVSIASSALIEGAISAYKGEGFWSGFANGAADGAMWGGIFALVGSTVNFVKNLGLIKSRGVVIGKGMDRVGFVADQAALSKYSPMKGYNLIKGSGKSMWRVSLADKLSIAHNKAWINRVMRLGKPIYDIGLGGIRDAGAWYGMELVEVANYFNYFLL